MQNKIISFNTGRNYSENGQRIAAMDLVGYVLMVDIDRGLEYVLLNANLERESIMLNYDRNNYVDVHVEFFDHDYLAMNETLQQLRDRAAAFPKCLLPN